MTATSDTQPVARDLHEMRDGGFFAVEAGDGEPRPLGDTPVLTVSRDIAREASAFRVERRFGYHDRTSGDDLVVPARESDAQVDLASIPNWLGWLTVKTGHNLPAAVLHDLLIIAPGDTVSHWVRPSGSDRWILADDDTSELDPVRADRVFREAMKDLGVFVFVRWALFLAVSLRTLWQRRPRHGIAAATGIIRFLGLLVLSLFLALFFQLSFWFEWLDWPWWAFGTLPGLGERPWHIELGMGLVYVAATMVLSAVVFAAGRPAVRRTAAPGKPWAEPPRRLYWQTGALVPLFGMLMAGPVVITLCLASLFNSRRWVTATPRTAPGERRLREPLPPG